MKNHFLFGSVLLFTLSLLAQAAGPTTGTGNGTAPRSGVDTTESSGPVKIHAPCLDKEQLDALQFQVDLQACDTRRISGADIQGVLRSTKRDSGETTPQGSGNKNGILDNIESLIKQRIDCYYQGIYPDFNSAPGARCTGTPVLPGGARMIACNIADGEDQTNHLGQDCGPRGRAGSGYEISHFMGTHVQALKYYRNKVVKEIETSHHLVVQSPACRAMAVDYNALMEDAKKISNSITGASPTLYRQLFNKSINFCEKTDQQMQMELQLYSGSQADTNRQVVARGIPRIAACHLSTSREYRIMMFSAIAECEIMAGVRDFESHFPAEIDRYNAYVNGCVERANRKGDEVGHAKKSRSAGEAAGRREFDECYNDWVPTYFQEMINTRIPGRYESHNQIPGVSLLFAFGILARRRKGRSRRTGKFARQVARGSLFVTFNSAVLIISAYLSMSCGGGGGSGDSFPGMLTVCYPPKVVEAPGDTALIGRCCNPTDISQPKPGFDSDPNGNDCQTCHLAVCSSEGTHAPSQAAIAADYSNRENNAARTGASDSPSAGQLNPDLGNSSAATAGDTTTSFGPAHPGGGPGPYAEYNSPLAQNAGAGRDGPGGAGGSGGANPLGSTSTQTMALKSQDPYMADPTGTGGTATAGGAGGGGTKGGAAGSGGGSRWGLDGAGGGTAGGGIQALTFSGAKPEGNPMLSADPDDYFSMIGVHDSIFKIVERRYQRKTMSWELPPAIKPAVKP